MAFFPSGEEKLKPACPFCAAIARLRSAYSDLGTSPRDPRSARIEDPHPAASSTFL